MSEPAIQTIFRNTDKRFILQFRKVINTLTIGVKYEH
ncbi:hypothetical protein R83H12_03042 [Fibrobacteria bacterium R8-3-H12]